MIEDLDLHGAIGALAEIKKYIEQWEDSLNQVLSLRKEMLTNKKLREAVKKDTEAILLSRGVPTDLAKRLYVFLDEDLRRNPPITWNNTYLPNTPIIIESSQKIPSLMNRRLADRLREAICGETNDSEDVELYDGSMEVSKKFVDYCQWPVGLIRWNYNLRSKYKEAGNVAGLPMGSGVLIAKDLFLTAAHVIDPSSGNFNVPRRNDNHVKIDSYEMAQNMHITLGYQLDKNNNLKNGKSFQILELKEHSLGNLDYAIVKVDGNPGLHYHFAPISPKDANFRDIICIIGHANGLPKRMDAGPITYINSSVLGYNSIDTLGGDSGAPIFHYPNGKIIGIHTHGGCNNPSLGRNHGIRISALLQVSPILHRLSTRI
jgi:V8-like Glu-specific endopeptidase